MISIELLRNEPDRVKDALRRRGEEAPIDRALELDVRRRSVIVEADGLRARRNEVSRQLGQTKERPP
ncbi:MAG: serine--tRNA ligase, partial [Chloroflexi bacterium]|nr:serine--tRNA ligase [Chloroflexota bacterium]